MDPTIPLSSIEMLVHRCLIAAVESSDGITLTATGSGGHEGLCSGRILLYSVRSFA